MNPGAKDITRSLAKWHEGDRQELDALLERHLAWIQGQVRKRLSPLLRGRGETCDFAQDVVMQFLRYAPRFTISNEHFFRALLLRIVKNSLADKYDWYTARRRDIARERPLPSDTVLSLDPGERAVRTPSMSAQRNEREAWIRLGMEFLDPEDREVLVLRKWDGLSFSEIGERFEISPEAARKRHNKAIERLSDRIWHLRSGKLDRVLEDLPSSAEGRGDGPPVGDS